MHASCDGFLLISFELISWKTYTYKERTQHLRGSAKHRKSVGFYILSYFRAMLTFRAGYTHAQSRANHAVRRKYLLEWKPNTLRLMLTRVCSTLNRRFDFFARALRGINKGKLPLVLKIKTPI